jgi:hypothetical protein
MYLMLLTFISLPIIQAYQLCVIGATSGLGKELVYQAAHDKNMSVLALSGSNKILTVPCRVNSFQEIKNQPPFNNPNVVRDNYWKDLSNYNYETLIFTTGAAPFKNDYSDSLMSKILPTLPDTCKHVILISAHGVGSSLSKDEIGIQVMNSWYLRNVYKAKNSQEDLLKLNIIKTKYPKLKTSIYRPKALSYGATMLPSISRQELASQILKSI